MGGCSREGKGRAERGTDAQTDRFDVLVSVIGSAVLIDSEPDDSSIAHAQTEGALHHPAVILDLAISQARDRGTPTVETHTSIPMCQHIQKI